MSTSTEVADDSGIRVDTDVVRGIEEPVPIKRRKSWKRPLRRFSALIGIIVIWWLASLFMSPQTLPGPFLVFSTMLENLTEGDTYYQLAVTMGRVLGGMTIAMIMGLVIGLIMGLSAWGEDLLINVVLVGFSIPAVVFGILFILWFGLNDTAAILAVGVAATPAIAINIWQGTKAIDRDLMHMGKAFRFSQRSMLTKVVIPQLVPFVLAALRTALAISWKIVTVVELIGLSSGVGYMLHWWFGNFNMTQVLAWTLLFTITLLLIENLILKPIEKRLTRWRPHAAALEGAA
ncbi:ABC transporter permease [Microbacterium sp.]|uniref:ABC transporter permease n=1 Tax=Microbacterium sp. TaxID=51671 RepID=UPI002D79D63D|nr:ABC transporter permease [Microbacterium sp.]HET6299896.1 ABC transporter permease [Microbacterium sp.]